MSGLAAIVIDCERAAPLAKFWSLALGWPIRPYDQAEIERLAAMGHTPETDPTVAIDSPDGRLSVFCVEVPEPKVVKNRVHLDIRVRDRAHFDQLIQLGAQVLTERESWVVMADPEGNEFDVVDPQGVWT
ncbi:MAG TPA: VOC family protein [Actinomycetes bacterium]|nr:VOC family protein [Actinomycetes bacterium]